jgi:hypothetical protein
MMLYFVFIFSIDFNLEKPSNTMKGVNAGSLVLPVRKFTDV